MIKFAYEKRIADPRLRQGIDNEGPRGEAYNVGFECESDGSSEFTDIVRFVI